jgi:hypothetical protein
VYTAVLVVGVGVVVVVVVVVDVSHEVIVTELSCVVVTGFVFGVSSNKFGEAPSHLTQKSKTNVDHEATTVRELHSRSSYQSSTSESDLQQR